MSGTMWRVRTNNLPSAWKDGKAKRISNELTEASSFAYRPLRGKAVIQYNHHGPRHRLLVIFLEKLGADGPINICPELRSDALERLQHASIVTRLEYSLGEIPSQKPLREAGVGAALDTMKSVKGASIHVKISLGRQRPRNRGLRFVKQIASRLVNIPGVQTLKAAVKPDEDHPIEMLDLIQCRKIKEIVVEEAGRQLNHADCRSKLRMALVG